MKLLLVQLGSFPTPYGLNISSTTSALATVRKVLQGASEDLGISTNSQSTLVDADGNALIFTRTVEVHTSHEASSLARSTHPFVKKPCHFSSVEAFAHLFAVYALIPDQDVKVH